MSKAVDPREQPERVLDGVQIAKTETGDRYTVTVRDDGDGVTVASLDGNTVMQPTIHELELWIQHGEYYIPEYSPATHVTDAITALAQEDSDD